MHLPDRNKQVDRLAGSIRGLSGRHLRELKHLLGNPPSMANVPASFWQDVQREMEEELTAAILLLLLASVDHHGGDVDVVEGAMTIQAAERSAMQGQRYADAVKGRTETLLAETVREPDARKPPEDLPGTGGEASVEIKRREEARLAKLIEELEKTFDAQAERIAASETTNAETVGGDAAAVTKWGDVSQDDIWRAHPSRTKTGSCQRCLRLDGTKRKDWGRLDEEAAGGPMLHEHCACTIEYADQGKPPQKAA
jgi:hypothetical protein